MSSILAVDIGTTSAKALVITSSGSVSVSERIAYPTHRPRTGYAEQEGYKNEKGQELLKLFPDAKTPDGLYFNPYFANLNIAMPAPLASDDQVTYTDGTKATVDQMSQDVSAFLAWTAEPKLDKRKQTGWAVLGFLLFATTLAYMAYRNIWAGKKGH